MLSGTTIFSSSLKPCYGISSLKIPFDILITQKYINTPAQVLEGVQHAVSP